jgi:hypothetical protein
MPIALIGAPADLSGNGSGPTGENCVTGRCVVGFEDVVAAHLSAK